MSDKPIKRILLLGGTREALTIARELGPQHIYSLAGLGKVPNDLTCIVRVGGFGGAVGLAQFIENERIDLLLDATHPYAAQISANAASAAQQTHTPYWALRRPGWHPQVGDDWRNVASWSEIIAALENFQRPFFTMGREPLSHLGEIPASQFWTIRCLDTEPGNTRATVIGARGPFTLDGERELFTKNNFDIVISKNSGSAATEPKLQIARELKIPVVILQRPPLPPATREFDSISAVTAALHELVRMSARYVVGIGCRRDCSEQSLHELLVYALSEHHIPIEQLAALASIDSKRDETGLHQLAENLNLSVLYFSAEQLLNYADRVSEATDIVLNTAGTNVAEASALAGAEMLGKQRAELIIRKCKNSEATFALAVITEQP